jgi:hypothetical protein
MKPEVRFGEDSPLEEAGFEPSVPLLDGRGQDNQTFGGKRHRSMMKIMICILVESRR